MQIGASGRGYVFLDAVEVEGLRASGWWETDTAAQCWADVGSVEESFEMECALQGGSFLGGCSANYINDRICRMECRGDCVEDTSGSGFSSYTCPLGYF